MRFSLQEIIEATGGDLISGSLKARVRGVSTDTRRVKKGQLFVAIKGDNFDGHEFLAQAIKSGATALLVSRRELSFPPGVAVIAVEDTVRAYGFLARYYRRKFTIPVIAITGSAGKTTTKEMVAAVLKTRFRVLYNRGTENNHIGVPSTLLKMTPRHEVAVIEMGTNHPGEIAWLGTVTEPTIAVFTNIGPSHLAGLGSPEGVLKEKSALINHTAQKGAMIVNGDDPLLACLLKHKFLQKVIRYAVDNKADLIARQVLGDARRISFVVSGKVFELKTPVWGNVYNALAAIACGKFLKVPVLDIQKGLARFQPPKGRQVFRRVKGVTVIDDTYNANPLSFKNAVRTLSTIKGQGRAILIAADMLELGADSAKLHREVGIFAANHGVDVLLSCGELARLIGDEANKVNCAVKASHFATKDELLAALKKIVRTKDVVLVKGSRGMKMESVVLELIAHLKG